MKRARFQGKILTAQTSTPMLAPLDERLRLIFIEMTIEELLKGEEKLNRYKELKQWKDLFEKSKPQIKHSFYHVDCTNVSVGENTFVIPENISNIIISALDAEIKKLDEE